ncbi:MAG: hypothetical protein FWF29_06040 [Treponema sp.]|nr:hypothetical protein [Treponema sp.]
MKKLFFYFIALCLVTLFTACNLDNSTKQDTYFIHHAGLSTETYNYIQTTPGITAQQAYSNALQFPVIPDPSLVVKTDQTRQQVIDFLNTGGSSTLTTQVMALVDQTGAAFQTYFATNGLWYYVYVLKD